MHLGASESKVIEFLSAEFAGEDLKLVRDVSDLIPQQTVKLIVHVALPEYIDEILVI